MKSAAAGMALLGPGVPFITRRALAADPLYVGVLSPVSGFVAEHGGMERAGMQMAVDEFKEKGVLGRPSSCLWRMMKAIPRGSPEGEEVD